MWATPEGIRVLKPAEREAFLCAALHLVEDLYRDAAFSEDSVGSGNPFERLSALQKICVVAGVSTALVDETADAPVQTAVNEGAVAAVFCRLSELVGIPGREGAAFRKLAVEALREAGIISPKGHVNRNDWEHMIDALSDLVLWDADYTDDSISDLAPTLSEEVRSCTGIDEIYYSHIVPEPAERDVEQAVRAMRSLGAGFLNED